MSFSLFSMSVRIRFKPRITKIKTTLSDKLILSYGIPQGSVLGLCVFYLIHYTWYGISGQAQIWFPSYFQNGHQSVKIRDTLSDKITLSYGFPQGSGLGPVLFTLYTTTKKLQHCVTAVLDWTTWLSWSLILVRQRSRHKSICISQKHRCSIRQ